MLKWNGGGNPTTLIMKKYKILQDTVANGSKVHAGDIVELDQETGHSLCGYGKAEIHVEKPKVKQADRSVGLETSDVKAPKKRAKK
jgi:DNA helicase TIP49 (TBP-interacting protein)